MIPGRYIVARQSVKATGRARIYVAGNHIEGMIDPEPPAYVREAMVQAPSCPIGVPVIDAKQAYDRALTAAGAFPRDKVDQRIVNEVKKGTGNIRRNPGTIPEIAEGTPYTDSDGDGMPDSWEKANGTDPNRNDAWEDVDGDGWTNFDEFLDHAHRHVLTGSSLSETQGYSSKAGIVTAGVVALAVAAIAGLRVFLKAAVA
jgi:hypothetical protein